MCVHQIFAAAKEVPFEFVVCQWQLVLTSGQRMVLPGGSVTVTCWWSVSVLGWLIMFPWNMAYSDHFQGVQCSAGIAHCPNVNGFACEHDFGCVDAHFGVAVWRPPLGLRLEQRRT